MPDAEKVEQLVAERAIMAVIHAYARALDTRDWTLLASVFTPDAIVDYTDDGGPVCYGPDAVVADNEVDFKGLDATQHMIGNISIAVDGNRARASCNLQALHYRARASGGTTLLLVGGYDDELEYHAGEWKIARRKLWVSFETGNPEVRTSRDEMGKR